MMRIWAALLTAPLLLAAHGRVKRVPRATPAGSGGPDAGVGIAIRVGLDGGFSDAGPRSGGSSAEVETLRRQVSELQARTSMLEQQASRGRYQEQLLQQLSDQMAALRQQMAAGQQQRADAQQQAQTQREDAQAAISGLTSVQSALAGGNLDVDAALAEAQGSMPPQAQRDLAAARDALRNHDLYNARAQVAQAIADAQQGR
jgi:chromosome segregation ATPase